jgi:hypothetical protein
MSSHSVKRGSRGAASFSRLAAVPRIAQILAQVSKSFVKLPCNLLLLKGGSSLIESRGFCGYKHAAPLDSTK